jgi:MFS family permease
MYPVQNLLTLRRRAGATAGGLGRGVSRTVVVLGFTSMFTDVSSEMVAAILPLYLVFGVGLSPIQFGVVDGLYQGISAITRIASGVVGDRWRRHKEVAATGYALSALTRLALPLVGSAWTAISAVVTVDRVGKGIRTAPRDAMISLSSPREGLGAAFGVHRAMDTAGAMLGPLIAFGILALAPQGYDAVFVTSFCFAAIGLAILWLFVEGRPAAASPAASQPEDVGTPPPPTMRETAAVLGSRQFRLLILAGTALAVATVSDAFVYLVLQRRGDFDATLLPLLYFGTALAYMLLAIPIGRLADAVGRKRVFMAGYGVLLALYATLLIPNGGAVQVVGCLVLLGTYYASTDGVLMAIASAVLPSDLRATGLAALVTGISLGRLLAALAFGALWTWTGPSTALLVFSCGLVLAMGAGSVLFLRTRGALDDERTAV